MVLYTGAGDDTVTMITGNLSHVQNTEIHYRGGDDVINFDSWLKTVRLDSTISFSDISVRSFVSEPDNLELVLDITANDNFGARRAEAPQGRRRERFTGRWPKAA